MNAELNRSRVRRAYFAVFALLGVITGCGDPSRGTFNAAAAEKVAAEKGLKPGGPAAKESGKRLPRGRQPTGTGGIPHMQP
jgi:hypothetical protein